MNEPRAHKVRVRKSHDGRRWVWEHEVCDKYLPAGVPAPYFGRAPDWATAMAYARRHALNMHGVRI